MEKMLSKVVCTIVMCLFGVSSMKAQDKLTGVASVSPTGAAVYSIPIEAPKGVGDLIPSISISYNSQAGNGLIGFGGSINGISVITRGMKNLAHDATVQGVKFYGTDAYYLDGKRLILMSGAEGTDGAVYSPEGEPLTQVTYMGSNEFAFFSVDTNDGMHYVYGPGTARLSLQNPTVDVAWYIYSATNPLGQTMTYQYFSDGHYLYPHLISYGGNNSIHFEYEARPDTIRFAVRNFAGYMGKRLKTIETQVGNSYYRSYIISYNNTLDNSTTKFSRISSIMEFGENYQEGRNLTATWNALPNPTPSTGTIGITLPANSSLVEHIDRNFLACDLNGDGISDILQVSSVWEHHGYSELKYYVYVYRSIINNGVISYNPLPLLFQTSDAISVNDWIFQKGAMSATDIDGDGYNDMLFPNFSSSNGTNTFFCNIISGSRVQSGNNTFDQYSYGLMAGTEMPLYTVVDINNNGKGDLLILEKQPYNEKYVLCLNEYNGNSYDHSFLHLTLNSTPRRMFASDFNNDGLADIMVICDGGYRIFYNQGGNSLASTFVDSSSLNTSIGYHQHIDMGDFNGDGIPDLVWGNQDTFSLYFEIGNGDGTFTQRLAYNSLAQINIQNLTRGTWNCIVTDIDHDGKSDIVLNAYDWWNEITHTYWLCSNGTSLIKRKEATSRRMEDSMSGHIFAGDFKGRGYNEIANYGYNCYDGVNSDVDPTLNIYSCPSHHVSNGKIKKITDSNNKITSFDYESLSSDQIYTKGTGSQYPIVDIAAPLCVTSRITESGNSSVTTQTDYTYAGLRAHLQGRGLLGFRTMAFHEINTGKSVTTTTSNDSPIFYVPTKRSTITTQGGCTSTSETTMTLKTFNSAPSQNANNYMLFPTVTNDVDIFDNVTTTTRTYDNVKHYLTSERIENDGGNMYKQTSFVYTPTKIGGAWRPISITQTQKHSDDNAPSSKSTTINYNDNGQKTSVTEYATSPLALTTTYEYDSYGNITKVSLSGCGVSSDTQTNYQYDSSGRFVTQKTIYTSSLPITSTYNYNYYGDLMEQVEYANTSTPISTAFTRDGFGMITQEINSTGDTVVYTRSIDTEYNSAYKIKATRSGHPTMTTWYDSFDNETHTETTAINSTKLATTTTHDISGRVSQKSKTHGNLTITENYSYDGLGRLAGMSSTDGTSVLYSYDNRSVTTTKNGQSFFKTYDAWGNLLMSEDEESTVYYEYYSNGKPAFVDSDDTTISIEYDTADNQTSLSDPDAGTITYSYDALHRLVQQTEARGKETTYSYDEAGRVTGKVVDGTTTTYNYGTTGTGACRLVDETTANCSKSYSYDNKGRVISETITMDGEQPLIFGYGYDNYGRLCSRTYPHGVSVSYVYDKGHRVATMMGERNVCVVSANNGSNVCRQYGGTLTYGVGPFTPIHNGFTITTLGHRPFEPIDPGDPFDPIGPRDPDPGLDPGTTMPKYYYSEDAIVENGAEYDDRGMLNSLTMTSSSDTLNVMTFNFESGTGNLLSRTGMTSQTEYFTYDNLDRLTQANGTAQHHFDYSANGNILTKTRVGSYTYNSNHPHAVVAVTNPLGSISSATQTASYTAFGKIASLRDNGYTMNFTYGPDEQRWKTVLRYNGIITRTTLYAGDYERVTEDGQTKHYYYLDNGVIYVLNDGETEGRFYYTFTDHLGSVTRIYSEYGNKVFSAQYDAWGQQTVTTDSLHYHRGYTGHEMLPEFGLINMNGRLYDPILGRFLSPDNYVQLPDFSQSFNRYSYCLNNPLKYSDPSGELFGIDDLFAFAVLGGVVNVAMNFSNIDSPMDALKYFGVGALAGVASTYVGAFVGGALATPGVVSATGFLNGSIIGLASGAVGGFILGGGNSWATNGNFGSFFEDAFIGMAVGSVTGAVMGGVAGGIEAHHKGNNFWTGKSASTTSDMHLDFEIPDALTHRIVDKNSAAIPQMIEIDRNAEFDIIYSSDKIMPSSPEGILRSIGRPTIKGYNEIQLSKPGHQDLYHNFPRMIDEMVIKHGYAYPPTHGGTMYTLPGHVNGATGVYSIKINSAGIIYHRQFVPQVSIENIY